MADIIYYVNEKLGTVVAKMPLFEKDFLREIQVLCFKHYPSALATSMATFFVEIAWNNLYGKYDSALKNLFGKAHCNYEENEVFDIEKGKELAKQRLMKKVFDLREKIFYEIHMAQVEMHTPINKRRLHYWERLCEYQKNIEELEATY